MSRLVEAIDLKKLTADGVEFQVDANFVKDDHSDSEDSDLKESSLQHSKKECIGVFDEDVYEEGEPFKVIGRKMFNLVCDGRIKKRIIREGEGETPPEYATVLVHYNGYVEYEESPFDSTYIRNKPHRFTVNDGRVIAGLDFAVQSMKCNEKSQFLIHPDYAYKNCLLGRIPPNATVLFEVELLEIINSGATITYDKLSETEQQMFVEVYKYCSGLCEKAKKYFIDHDYKNAIKDYNTAAGKLEKVNVNSKEETEKRLELLLRVYTNLVLCYSRSSKPQRGCLNAKKIYEITGNGQLMKIHPKVYFNHAKCLRFLGEYEDAKTYLNKAYRMEPKNPEIANELLNLEKDTIEHLQQQKVFAKILVGEKSD